MKKISGRFEISFLTARMALALMVVVASTLPKAALQGKTCIGNVSIYWQFNIIDKNNDHDYFMNC